MDAADVDESLARILVPHAEILARIDVIARLIEHDYQDEPLIVVGILKGSTVVVADLIRALRRQIRLEWMAVSSYGAHAHSSGAVRILKDLDVDIRGAHVLIVEDIIDTGLTLSRLVPELAQRGAASVEVFALFRKPDTVRVPLECRYIGFDIPDEFVVGYGLDYAEQFRNLRDLAVLAPHVYRDA